MSNYTLSDLSGKLQDFTFHVIFFSLLENPVLFTFPIYRSWSPFGLHLCLSYSSTVRPSGIWESPASSVKSAFHISAASSDMTEITDSQEESTSCRISVGRIYAKECRNNATPPVISSISSHHWPCSSLVTLHCPRLDPAGLTAGDTLTKTKHQETTDVLVFVLQPEMQSR